MGKFNAIILMNILEWISKKFYEAHKWGFKIHLLCDNDTHFLYNMIFVPGKYGKEFLYFDKNDSISESIVL